MVCYRVLAGSWWTNADSKQHGHEARYLLIIINNMYPHVTSVELGMFCR